MRSRLMPRIWLKPGSSRAWKAANASGADPVLARLARAVAGSTGMSPVGPPEQNAVMSGELLTFSLASAPSVPRLSAPISSIRRSYSHS
jgi:hypothetical protein